MAKRRWTKRDSAIVAVTALAMEPITYLAHRFVMHGFGYSWHGAHHEKKPTSAKDAAIDDIPATGLVFDKNDLFPIVFASSTIAAIAVGSFGGPKVLRPIGAGISAYGIGYLFVHDLYIHRRVRLGFRHPAFERLADAHALHHRFNGEPYGFLYPIVPASVRARDGRTPSLRTRDELLGITGA